jgi:hypothetical protein
LVIHGIHRPQDVELTQTALDMIQWSFDNGWDEQHGGIFYFLDRKGYSPIQLVGFQIRVPNGHSFYFVGVADEAVVGPQRNDDCHAHGIPSDTRAALVG